MNDPRILIIDDDIQKSSLLKNKLSILDMKVDILKQSHYATHTYYSNYSVFIINISEFCMNQGIIKFLIKSNKDSKIIVIGNVSDEKQIVTLFQKGVCYYLKSPVDLDLFLYVVRHALEVQKLESERDRAELELEHSHGKQHELLENLEKTKQELTDTNRALAVITRNFERAKKEAEAKIIGQIRSIILPIIEQMRKDQHMTRYESKLTMITNYVESIDSNHLKGIHGNISLSPRELRIALMIKYGMTTEEIAEHLYINTTTVKTHRRNIRKKLGAHGMKQRLRVHLQTLEQDALYRTEEHDLDVALSQPRLRETTRAT